MPAGFAPGNGRFTTLDQSLRFEMARSGSDFLQTVVKNTPTGEARTTARIDLVYGANKADEVFFSWKGERLYELIAVWLHPLNRWGHASYNPHGSGDFSRETTTRCVECHNTFFEHVPGTANEYKKETVVLGVTCERCHGPGREHIDFRTRHKGAAVDSSAVHPGRLARERQIEVCTQCHANATKARGPAFAYRPGEPLEVYFRTAVTRHPEEDHVANQIKYLRQSKCFQKSDSLTCVTCHDPHRPADAAAARESCLQCHQPDACTDRPKLPNAVREDCVGCHMPRRVWMNVHFHTDEDRYVPPVRRTQHRIAVDPVARSEVLLGWHRTSPGAAATAAADRLTSELVGHWLMESDRYRRGYRFLAAIGAAREALRLGPGPELRRKVTAALGAAIDTQTKLDAGLADAFQAADAQHYLAAMDALERILTVKPDWAVVHSKLGTLYAVTGQKERAIKHLNAVALHDPDNASGLAMLGWLAYLDGQSADAADFYRRAEEIEPYDAKINYHWGLALARDGHWPEAADRFRRALKIDPRHAGAHQGLSHVLREQGRAGEAVRAARRAARLTGFDHPDVLITLAEAYAAAGRTPEAAAAAAKAIDVAAAQQGGSPLPPDVRRRLEELRARVR